VVILTPEQRNEIVNAGEQPIRFEDPETHARHVIMRAEVYERMRAVVEGKTDSSSYDDSEFDPKDDYPAIDLVFREGWDDPRMAKYDHYEKHRP
jgi:hypothetical protein